MKLLALKNKPKFSWSILSVFILTFVFAGTYLVYQMFAGTTVTHTFKISPTGAGTVVNSSGTPGATVYCPTDCSQAYAYSATSYVSYKAYPVEGYRFAGWENSTSIRSGYDYTSNPFNVNRTKSWTFTAIFVKIDPNTVIHSISISPNGAGTVKNVSGMNGAVGAYVNCPTDCVGVYPYDTTAKSPITYQAYANPGYTFVGWERTPSAATGTDYTYNPMSWNRISDWTMTALFVADITHTVIISPSGAGTVKNISGLGGAVGAYINCPTDCTASYPYDPTATSPITYQAYPNAGYTFVGWERSPSVRTGTDYTYNPMSWGRTINWTYTAIFTAAPLTEQQQAEAIVKRYTDSCTTLSGITVSFGDAKGYQAITYYISGRIIISPTHTATLENILKHEIYHVYDWRDNGVINWNENIPPSPAPACMVSAYPAS